MGGKEGLGFDDDDDIDDDSAEEEEEDPEAGDTTDRDEQETTGQDSSAVCDDPDATQVEELPHQQKDQTKDKLKMIQL